MSTALHYVSPTTTIGEAVALMAQHRIGSTLVLEGGRLVGIFTERDTVRALSASSDAPADEVSSWMTPDPMTVAPDVATDQALKTMLANDFRHLPVIEDGELVGIVSIRDLAR